MRVAANEVERTLELANIELSAQREAGSITDSRDSLMSAFKHAAELRDKPVRQVMLPGLKSGVKQMVEVTNIRKDSYVECIINGYPQWVRKYRLDQAA